MRSGHAALRKGRSSVSGQSYLVTFATHDRRPYFTDWHVAREAAQILTSTGSWPDAHVLAWVLMPDHWHGLVVLDEPIPLSTLMKRAKGTSAHSFNRHTGRQGLVWRDGFHDRAIRRDEDLRAVARYVIANPIRAGLVESVAHYPFWDAAWLGQDQTCVWDGL